MKRRVAITSLVVGLIIIGVDVARFIYIAINDMTSVSIIGGADGPTTIFLVGKLGGSLGGSLVLGISLVIIGIFLFKKRD